MDQVALSIHGKIEAVPQRDLDVAVASEGAAKASLDAARSKVTRAGLDVVELRVRSGGSGFPPDKLEKVFDLFERGEAETAVAGMGIGLAICRSIVEAHGGSIRAFNPPGGGGCVAFCLPRGTPPPVESEALPLDGAEG